MLKLSLKVIILIDQMINKSSSYSQQYPNNSNDQSFSLFFADSNMIDDVVQQQ